jgi:hypothetical protein
LRSPGAISFFAANTTHIVKTVFREGKIVKIEVKTILADVKFVIIDDKTVTMQPLFR